MRCPRCEGRVIASPVIDGPDERECMTCGWVEVPEAVMAASLVEAARPRGFDPRGKNWTS